MPTFTPRTTKEGMSSPSSPYNDIHYVGGLTTNHNSNKYNYNNVNTYQCTYYCLARLGEESGEPVQTFSIAPNPNVKHRLFSRSGFGDGKEWFNDTLWDKSSDKTKPKLGAVVCYSKYPNDGGGGHVQIVEKIEGDTIYVSQNQTAYSNNFLTAINVNDLSSSGTKAFQGYIYNPYLDGGDVPSGIDVINFTNNSQYAYIEWDSSRGDSGYDYKLQLVAPYFALAGNPNNVSDGSMNGWELVARINGGFFFKQGGQAFANGLEKQHWTWNEQYDDTEYDNVLAIGGDGSNNTRLSSARQGDFREYYGEWCLTGGTSLQGGDRISSAVDSNTGHAFLGYNGRKIIMGCSKSGVSGASLRSHISSLGYVGVELDGGGSTVFNYLGTNYSNTYDGRSVKNVICLYRKKKETPKVTVTLNIEPSGSGIVTGDGTYDKGVDVLITAKPNDGFKFINWSDGNTESERVLHKVQTDINLTAIFEKKKGILITGSMGIDFQIVR